MDDGNRRPERGVVGTTVTTATLTVAFGAAATLLACRFPSRALWIVGGMSLLFCFGMGMWIGLDWSKPSAKPEDRQQVKRLGLMALVALAGVVLFDAFMNGLDLMMSAYLTLAVCLGSGMIGFFVGRWIGGRRNTV